MKRTFYLIIIVKNFYSEEEPFFQGMSHNWILKLEKKFDLGRCHREVNSKITTKLNEVYEDEHSNFINVIVVINHN